MILDFILALILILFPLGQLERIPFQNTQVGLYFHDLLVAVFLVVALVKVIKSKKKNIRPAILPAIYTVVAVMFLSLAVNAIKRSGAEILVASLYLFRWVGYAGVYLLLKKLGKSTVFGRSLTVWLIFAGLVAALFGLAQYVFYPDIRPLTVYAWDPHYFRVVGTYLEPGFAGLIFVFTMILIVEMFWNNFKSGIFLLIPTFTAFALTYSRSAFVAYIAAVIIISRLKRSWKLLVIAVVLLSLTVIILPRPGGEGIRLERQSTIWARFVNWNQAISIFKQNPGLGVGFNFYRYAQRDAGFLTSSNWYISHAGAGADNSFLFILATMGIIGLTAYVYLLVKIMQAAKYKIVAIMATLAAFTVHALFNNSLFFSWTMLWFWLMLAAYGV